MIRFTPTSEPSSFQPQAVVPGKAWLQAHPNAKRPKDYWTPFKPALAEGFRHLCAYSALYLPTGLGTVDHFISTSENRDRAYDWSNYRYASPLLNQRKGKRLAASLLDPFEVEDGWFEILLPSLQLRLTDKVPTEFRKRAEFMLEKLRLIQDESVILQRQDWYEMYRSGELTLEGLEKKAPLIAAAIRRDLAKKI